MGRREATSHSTAWIHERDLLGALLISAESGDLKVDRLENLSTEHFVGPHAAATFAALRGLLQRGTQVDRHVLVDELVTRHGARRSDALDYVDALVADAPPQPHLGERIRRVCEAAARRKPRA
ncbi:MAG: DnaB-like helicase N-terminal domain-containing protein [Solirubrobacteraceae bacterium]